MHTYEGRHMSLAFRDVRLERRERGLCVHCGKSARPSRTTCEPCAKAIYRQRQQGHHEKAHLGNWSAGPSLASLKAQWQARPVEVPQELFEVGRTSGRRVPVRGQTVP